MVKAPVFPVPDYACAIVSFPCTIGSIALLCIKEGSWNPNAYIPYSSYSLRYISGNRSTVFSQFSTISSDATSDASSALSSSNIDVVEEASVFKCGISTLIVCVFSDNDEVFKFYIFTKRIIKTFLIYFN